MLEPESSLLLCSPSCREEFFSEIQGTKREGQGIDGNASLALPISHAQGPRPTKDQRRRYSTGLCWPSHLPAYSRAGDKYQGPQGLRHSLFYNGPAAGLWAALNLWPAASVTQRIASLSSNWNSGAAAAWLEHKGMGVWGRHCPLFTELSRRVLPGNQAPARYYSRKASLGLSWNRPGAFTVCAVKVLFPKVLAPGLSYGGSGLFACGLHG